MASYQSPYTGRDIDKAVHFVHNKIAEPFKTSKTYVIGEFVSYEGLLYQCIEDVTTAGAWSAENWQVQRVFDNEGFVILDCNQDYDLELDDLAGTTWEFINIISNSPYPLPTLPDTTIFNITDIVIQSGNGMYTGINLDSGSASKYSSLNLLTQSNSVEVMRSEYDAWDGVSDIVLNQFTSIGHKRVKFISGDNLKNPLLIKWFEQNAAQITDAEAIS